MASVSSVVITVSKGVQRQQLTVPAGTLLSDALRECRFAPSLPCGGCRRCGGCRVTVTGAVEPPSLEELRLLGDYASTMRLACFTAVTGDCAVSLPDAGEAILLDGVALPCAVTPREGMGIAVDIGTTTVAVYAFDLSDGRELGRDAFANPQGPFGADVISRITAAEGGAAHDLSAVMRDALEAAFARLCPDVSALRQIVLTGNTAMLYLLLQRDIGGLARVPFHADDPLGIALPAAQCGFANLPSATVYFPPLISPFVGADITCAMLPAFPDTEPEAPLLLMDIGTNGEMALQYGDRILCCATAAGPAFEGVGIRCGCHARTGAIHRVWAEDDTLRFETIGNAPANGLCGSGLIDAVAALLELGWLDETGYLSTDSIRFGASEVILTQEDIRALQLAKAAICAGVQVLLLRAGITANQVEHLLLAGGFGSGIRADSAAAIGLFPPELADRVQVIGNGAGMGACACLLSPEMRHRCSALVERAQPLNLAEDPAFMDLYVEAMLFE